ncbi:MULTISPECIES: 3'-5' exonuclease [Solibacillus]|uniref:Exonuclease domain-containing protein n=1 Tax=Solibacillus merdavium TaxID=2762218 RepID=A0ABR8XKC8_9BACL|nr:3'-5' exonuclease [Solibacillus merdavium]MBD8032366.1 exonuclease domain-containing protein [Solibacillus merdavium]
MGRTKTYISIDVEAALIRGKQYIIEIGAVKWLPDGTTETFTQLIQPYKFKRLNVHIQKLTGITTEQLLDAPSFKEAFYKFKRWCKQDYIFLTFGEFDRKVLEEELSRNYIKNDCLYPMIDFQQKYMIANGIKEQPSLGGLMAQLGLENETQHRALADAASLLSIFMEVDGENLIKQQQTNDFLLLLTNFRMLETTYELVISTTYCKVEDEQVHIQSMQTFRDELPFTVYTVEQQNEEGEVTTIERINIKPNEQAKQLLQQISYDAKGKILISRTPLRSMSKILKLHNVALPKTEVMTLTNLLKKEEIIGLFHLVEESTHAYESKILRLVRQYEHVFVEEFHKRALTEKHTIQV